MQLMNPEISNNRIERLRHVCWMITGRCNLRCPICHAYIDKYELRLSQKLRIIDKLKTFGITCFTITGGEPLIDSDWLSIMRNAKQLGFYIGMCTNGILLNDELIEKAIGNLDEISIPLDSPTDDLQKIHRNYNEFFNIALKRIESIVSAGLTIDVGTVVTKYNVNELSKIRLLLKDLKVNRWKLLQYYRLGTGTNNKIEFDITPAQFITTCKQQQNVKDGIQVIVRPGSEAVFRSYVTLSPSGKLLLSQNHEYVNIGSIFSFKTTEHLIETLNFYGFNFARHSMRPIGSKQNNNLVN